MNALPRKPLAFAAALGLASFVAAPSASAFCGFYVGGADAKLFNNATQVAMMRDGTRTVLAMQNDYQGPPERFAMVVPVPVVLQKDNVKTLPRELFERLDRMTAPRLVEYWEQDPCAKPEIDPQAPRRVVLTENKIVISAVKIEAKFSVGEYDVVILSAKDSSALDRWLKAEKYEIPEGAEPYLRPYVQAGSKFFVAKVDPKKVKMVNGHAALSPLRFHYDTSDFSLPVRLGLVNSAGTQDLIVNVFAQNQRYEPANYPSVTIPTNLDVAERSRADFGKLYAALFDATLEKHKGAVITEYAWDATTCDPCPGPTLGPEELLTLGADVIPGKGPAQPKVEPAPTNDERANPPKLGGVPFDTAMASVLERCWEQIHPRNPKLRGKVQLRARRPAKPEDPPVTVAKNDTGDAEIASCFEKTVRVFFGSLPLEKEGTSTFKLDVGAKATVTGWTVTRLHARYTKDALGPDIVFRAAAPIAGGREVRDSSGRLEHGSTASSMNNFQARYAIRHPWQGAIACSEPLRGRWGGPRGAERPGPPAPASDLAFTARDAKLVDFLRSDVPELGIALAPPSDAGTAPVEVSEPDAGITPAPLPPAPRGCGGCTTTPSRPPVFPALVAIGVAGLLRRRRRR